MTDLTLVCHVLMVVTFRTLDLSTVSSKSYHSYGDKNWFAFQFLPASDFSALKYANKLGLFIVDRVPPRVCLLIASSIRRWLDMCH